MTIPFKMSPLGRGKSDLPAGYLAAEFLESTGMQYVALPSNRDDYRIPEKTEVRCVCQYTKVDRRQICGFSNNIWFDVDIDGKLGIFGKNVSASPLDKNEVYYSNLFDSSLKRNTNEMTVRGETVKSSDTSASTSTGWRFFAIVLFVNSSPMYYCFMKLWEASVKMDDVEYKIKPALDPQGVPCFYDKVTKTPFYNSGSGSFIVGLTLDQARNLRKLPATGGNLTVSLPWEAQLVQHNADVESALQTAKNSGWTITVQYREPEADNEYYNKYAECVTVDDMLAVNADYKNDLTSDGEWIYPLPKLENAKNLFHSFRKIKAFSADAPNLINASNMFGFTTVQHIKINMPLVTSLYYFCGDGYPLLTFETTDLSLVTNGYEAFKVCGQLRSFEYPLPSLENGVRMFHSTVLDKASVLCILNSLPTYTSGVHNLTIGIHIDHQTDEEVIAAISAAEAKGWTLTVQWNGTATAQTASTFGLRKPPIYAKLGTVERPDGTTENVLDWGHYVTNWGENGYQEFSSIEEAEEHFNIKQTEEA